MTFLRHHPCEHCGSKDNLAEYKDHYYCFGCGYYKSKDDIESLKGRLLSSPAAPESIDIQLGPIPAVPLRWLYGYGLTPDEISDMGWSETRQLLVLAKTDTFYQGRYFGDMDMPKYLSKGKKPLTVYGEGDTLVLTEDVISAIKVGRVTSSLPLFGSSLSSDVIEHVRFRGFKKVLVWLDMDKSRESILMRSVFVSRGIPSQCVFSPMDPKYYDTGQIKERLFG